MFLKKVTAMTVCVICGLKDWRLIEFHHVNPGSKKFALSQATTNRAGISTLKQELRKCIPVCPNCHRLIHLECVL